MTNIIQKIIATAIVPLLLTSFSYSVFADNVVPNSNEDEATVLIDTTQTNDENFSDMSSNSMENADSSWFSASDMFNTAVGAAAGFFLSMLLENWLRKRRRRKCIINIALELNDIKAMINDKKDNNTPALSYAIYIPIWEAVVGNGDILELRNEPYYDDLFLIYGHISRLSKLEDFAQENGITDMSNIIQQRAYIIKLLSSKEEFPDDAAFDEHQLHPLLDKYAR